MSSRYCAPVVIFSYRRKDKLEICINELQKCVLADNSDVIVFSDGYKDKNDKYAVDEVREYLHSIEYENRFKTFTVIEQPSNKGLATSIIDGVTGILKQYSRVIVVEDDLVVSKDFLMYMNDALDFYCDNNKYGCISAYTEPLRHLRKYKKDIYVTPKGDCWGWATWSDRWRGIDWDLKSFDTYLNDADRRKAFSSLEKGLEEQLIAQHEGRLDAWAARWCFHLFNKGMLTVYPTVCRAVNIGNDGTGVHCDNVTYFDNRLNDSICSCRFETLEPDKKLMHDMAHFGEMNLFSRLLNMVNIYYKKFMNY